MYIRKVEHVVNNLKIFNLSPNPIDPVTGEDPNQPVTDVTTPVSYYLYDHLGNTRMLFRADAPTAMTITYAADYYPYGKILREFNACGPVRFLTTQHERDAETGYDNRGARLYDAEVGRFLSVDPLAEDYSAWSGYNYVLGNPIRLVDPDGRAPQPPYVRLMFYGGAKRSSDNTTFLNAANNVNGDYSVKASIHGVSQGTDITEVINSQGEGTVQSIDIFTHGGTDELYFITMNQLVITIFIGVEQQKMKKPVGGLTLLPIWMI